MRKIKFRAWDKINKKWLILSELVVHASGGIMLVRDLDGEPYGLHQVELLQYIGLTDKNGKEIYEGDLVIAKYFWTEPHTIRLPEDYYWFSELAFHNGELEVIGNLYENLS